MRARSATRGATYPQCSEGQASEYLLREVGFIFQNFHLMPRVPAIENAARKLLISGVGMREAQARAIPWLERVGLADRLEHTPEKLSGGERQRVAIARALAGEPSLILADEPTGNLDSARSREIVQLLRSVAHERGARVLLVTHDREAAAIADRCTTLRDGKLTDGSPDADVRDPLDARARSVPAQSELPCRTPNDRRGTVLCRTRALVYFYSRRLRVHAMQELLAGLGVAVAVALVFAVTVANSSITSSASDVVHTVIGPADLQLHARGPDGFDEHLLARVEHLPGVAQAAPLLEQVATVRAPNGRQATVDVAGTNIGLALLDGLAHTLPIGALSPGGIGLSQTSASALGLPAYDPTSPVEVRLELRGRAIPLKVSAVLGHETAGALADAEVAVMPLTRLQQLAGLPGRVTRIFVESEPGHRASVERELQTVAAGRITVAPANQDISVLRQALRPSNQASELFAGLSALIGFLFAFNAMLLTVPERREAIADLRLDGATRAAIVQMVLFQALCLGVAASLVGLLGGYALSIGFFRQSSPGYLAQAFMLGTSTVIGAKPVLLSLGGGMLAMCLASLVPLQDLRRGRPIDAVFSASESADGVPPGARRWLCDPGNRPCAARQRSIRLGPGRGTRRVRRARAGDDARGSAGARARSARLRCGRIQQSKAHGPATGAFIAEGHDTTLAGARRDRSGSALWQRRAWRRPR